MKTLIRTSIIVGILLMSINKSFPQQSPLIKHFCTSMLYFKSNNPGVAAYLFETMKDLFPKDTYSEISARIDGIEFNTNTQLRLLYYLYRAHSDKVTRAYYFQVLCGYRDLAIQVSNYCDKIFIHPPKSVFDLKIKFDKIEQENREKQAQEASDNATPTKEDSANIKRYVDSNNAQLEKLEGTKQYLNLNEMLEFVKRKQFSVSDIKDYLLHVSSRKWNIEKFNNEIEISWNIDNSEAMDYNPQKHTLSIETSDDAFYNNIIKELNNGHYKKVIYHKHIPPEYYRALFQNKDYRIICSISRGGSMGNTNYEITISQSQTAKN